MYIQDDEDKKSYIKNMLTKLITNQSEIKLPPNFKIRRLIIFGQLKEIIEYLAQNLSGSNQLLRTGLLKHVMKKTMPDKINYTFDIPTQIKILKIQTKIRKK